MLLRYAILYVEDVPRTMNLYQQAFGLERRMLHPSEDYGELRTGDTRLAFSSKRLMTELGKTPGTADPARPIFELAFEVKSDQVATAYARATEAGFIAHQAVREESWGQTTSYVADPFDGFLIEICSPVQPQS